MFEDFTTSDIYFCIGYLSSSIRTRDVDPDVTTPERDEIVEKVLHRFLEEVRKIADAKATQPETIFKTILSQRS